MFHLAFSVVLVAGIIDVSQSGSHGSHANDEFYDVGGKYVLSKKGRLTRGAAAQLCQDNNYRLVDIDSMAKFDELEQWFYYSLITKSNYIDVKNKGGAFWTAMTVLPYAGSDQFPILSDGSTGSYNEWTTKARLNLPVGSDKTYVVAKFKGKVQEKKYNGIWNAPEEFRTRALCEANTDLMEGWEQVANPSNAQRMQHVEGGNFGVWATSEDDRIYFLDDKNNWVQTTGGSKLVSVGGSQVWSVNRASVIWRANIKSATAPGWTTVDGRKMVVSVSDLDHVWGVNVNHDIYRWTGGNSWNHIEGKMKQISVGPSGVWGVDGANDVYYRTGTYGDVNTDGSGWQKVDGQLNWVSSGDGYVMGVTAAGGVLRKATSAGNPTGSDWAEVKGNFVKIDVSSGALWGLNSAGEIWKHLLP